MAELKILKDYILMKGELYRRMPEGILSRCVGHEKAQRKLREVHGRTYGFYDEISNTTGSREWVFIGQT